MAKTIFEELGGRYERQGDYLIPCLNPKSRIICTKKLSA